MGKQKIKNTFNVSFAKTDEERFMLLVLHGLIEDIKPLPEKSQLIKKLLKQFMDSEGLTIPDNFQEKYGHYFEDVTNDNNKIKEVKKEEIKPSEPIKEEVKETTIVDDDDMGPITVIETGGV